jgi:hypothetical protein
MFVKNIPKALFFKFMQSSTETESKQAEDFTLVKNSAFYKQFTAEREEIFRHKWLESEKAGFDIGFEKALLDWIVKFRQRYIENRRKANSSPGASG